MTIKANYHTHTTFCDGSDSPEEVVQEALKKGFTHLGFSGHMDPGVSMDFEKYLEEINRLQNLYKGKIRIFRGAELDNVYAPEAVTGVEYIIGSTHFIPIQGSELWQKTAPYGTHKEGAPDSEVCGVDGSPEAVHDNCKKYFHGDYYEMSERYFAFESMVCDRLKPTFIGHLDLITRFNDLSKEDGGHFLDESDERYLVPARKAIDKLVTYGIPFEVNLGAVNRKRKHQPYPSLELLKYIKEAGGEVLLSSDAHQKELLDGAFEEGIDLIKEAGFDRINMLCRISDFEYVIPAKNTRDNTGGPLYWKQLRI